MLRNVFICVPPRLKVHTRLGWNSTLREREGGRKGRKGRREGKKRKRERRARKRDREAIGRGQI